MRWSKPAPQDGQCISAGWTTTARRSSTPSTPCTIRPRHSSLAGSEASVDRRGSEGKGPLPVVPAGGTPDLPRPATPSPWAASPRRWPRPRLTPGILTAVQDRYQLSWQGEPVDLGGSSNLNVHLPGDSGGYVLRVHRSWVSGPRLTVVQPALLIAARPGGAAIPGTDSDPRSAGLVG